MGTISLSCHTLTITHIRNTQFRTWQPQISVNSKWNTRQQTLSRLWLLQRGVCWEQWTGKVSSGVKRWRCRRFVFWGDSEDSRCEIQTLTTPNWKYDPSNSSSRPYSTTFLVVSYSSSRTCYNRPGPWWCWEFTEGGCRKCTNSFNFTSTVFDRCNSCFSTKEQWP